MNVGFSSLTALKAQLLNPDLQATTDYDPLVTVVGQSVAAHFEAFCNRRFCRVVGDTFTVPGNTRLFNLPRYPVEAITALTYRPRLDLDWQDGTNALANWIADAGLVELAWYLTDRFGQACVTYTGGFWWDDTEDASGVLPAGAFPLPVSIFSAWALQCEEVWRHRDALGLVTAAYVKGELRPPMLTGLDLLPVVQAALRAHVRYAP